MSVRRTTTAPPGAEQHRLQQVLRAGQARAAATGAPGEESSSSAAPFGGSFCRWWPVSDGLFDVHYTPEPANYQFTNRGEDFMIQSVIRVVADPLKHCPDGSYPGGVPREAAGVGGVVEVVGVPRWELGEPFNYLWQTAILKGRIHVQTTHFTGTDGLVEVNIYNCNINLNGVNAPEIPEDQMTVADVETQKVVKAFMKDANSAVADHGGLPTVLPPITFTHQDYVVMTTSILKGCTRCITSIGMVPSNKDSAPSGEFFNAMLAECPYHALGQRVKSGQERATHASEVERKRSRGV